jgi:DNA invertase Pin-like site-specific DNA recombinase
MRLGYARVSTTDQDASVQRKALSVSGCQRFYIDTGSGMNTQRVELQRLLTELRPGDTLVCWKLDRVSRSLKDLLELIQTLDKHDCAFESLTESIDTSTPAGRMMMQMVGSFAEFERAMLVERTRAGVLEARKQGRIGGRRPKLTQEQRQMVCETVASGEKTGADMARLFGVNKSTISRLLTAEGINCGPIARRPGPMSVSPRNSMAVDKQAAENAERGRQ